MLTGALKVDEEKIRSKGIKSVRNRVCNIKDFIKTKMETEEFMDYLEQYISREMNAQKVEFTTEDINAIQKLADEKYSTWEWNFGKSKEYTASKKKRYDFGSVVVDLTLDNGVIKDIKIYGDFFGSDDITDLENILHGVKMEKTNIELALSGVTVENYIMGMDKERFAELIIS